MAQALLAAGLVLQVPVCALACLSAGDAPPIAAGEHAEAPCHAPPSGSAPAPARPHDDCGCEEAGSALLPSLSVKGSGISSPALVAGTASSAERSTSPPRRASIPSEATDLPPPDILLLKSTLII